MIKNVHGNPLGMLSLAIIICCKPVGAAIPPEPIVCVELGVSRTVIRDSVKSLAAKGLITSSSKVDTKVLPSHRWNWFDRDVIMWQSRVGLTPEFLRDLQDLRRVMEPAAVRLAAERAASEDIANIETAYGGMRRAVVEGGDYVSRDLRFHQGLMLARRNRMREHRVTRGGAEHDLGVRDWLRGRGTDGHAHCISATRVRRVPDGI